MASSITEQDRDRPNIERDPAKILTSAFEINPKLVKEAEAIVCALKRDGLYYLDDHLTSYPTCDPHRKLKAVAFGFGFSGVETYDYLDAWFFPYVDSYDGQCKNPLYVDEAGKLHVSQWSRGSILTSEVLSASQKQGFVVVKSTIRHYYETFRHHVGMLVERYDSSFLKKHETGPHYYVTLIVRADDVIALFEKCLPKQE